MALSKLAKDCMNLALSSASLLTASHSMQIARIEEHCEEIRQKSQSTLTDNQAISNVIMGMKDIGNKGGLEFIWGDFEVVEGNARCGGRARLIAEGLSGHGFRTTIELEIQGFKLHYYCVAKKGGAVWNFR